MLLRIEDQYFNVGNVYPEKKAKTIEDILNAEGDITYSFTIESTPKLRALLNIETDFVDDFTPDIECDLLDDNGVVLYPNGRLVIEGGDGGELSLYFVGGNSSAASLLSGNLLDFDFLETPIAKSTSEISARWTNTTGIVFPLIDAGLLDGRVDNSTFEIEDFHPFYYVKSFVNTVLARRGIKLTGDILQDPKYNNLLFTTNNKDASETQLNKRRVNAGKITTQATTSGVDHKVTFTNITDNPYYSGAKALYSVADSRYTADTEMDVKVEAECTLSASPLWEIYVYVNGSLYSSPYVQPNGFADSFPAVAQGTSTKPYITFGDQQWYGQTLTIHLAAGDYVEIYLLTNTGDPNITSGYFKVTPIKFYTVLQESLLPNMTEAEFIYSVFSIFCPIIEFDSITKTLDVNLFENIKHRTPINFSQYIKRFKKTDYVEIADSYAQSVILAYNEGDSEEIGQYNEQSKVCYGCGEMVINNNNIDPEKEIQFGFSASFIKSNPTFGGHLLKYKFKEFEEIGDEIEITTVTNTGGIARFNCSSAHGLQTGKWVLISESSVASYNGSGKVTAIDTDTFEITNLAYSGTATAKAVRLLVNDIFSDGLYLTLHVPNVPIEDVSSKTGGVYLNSTLYTDVGWTYFDKPYTGKTIDNLKPVLSFDQVDTPEFYNSLGMRESHFRLFEKIINKSPKKYADALIPYSVYHEFKHKFPIRHNENLYYVNKISGYDNSSIPCEVELIKLP